MKSYLTYKGKNTVGTWIGLAVWILLSDAAISVLFDSLGEEPMSVFAAIFVAAPFIAGLVLHVLRIYHRFYAAKIDRTLGAVQKDRISCSELDRLCNITDSYGHLVSILRREMMDNIQLDAQSKTVILTAAAPVPAPQNWTAVICPHCGDSNSIPAGGSGKCEYCSQMISDRSQSVSK